ncbi:MAG: hypothetical protein KGL35_29010 [Bradyrhizobium sp.]|nr:hypothetical protein [Bradyrhizobium sp.]
MITRLGIFTALACVLAFATPASAGWCYGNNGASFRAQDSSAGCSSGEDYFSTTPTTSQLQAVFTAYNAAVAAQQAQQTYAAALVAGLTITSTNTPALNGTYAIDPQTQTNITAEQVYIATRSTFTNGQSTKAWPDKAGAFHKFPSTAAFTAFAVAVAQYIDVLNTALETAQQGGNPSWPSTSVLIP